MRVFNAETVDGGVNGDHVADAADHVILKRHLGTPTGGATLAMGDTDVDWADLKMMMDALNASSGGTTPSAPESAPLGPLLGAAALPRRRARGRTGLPVAAYAQDNPAAGLVSAGRGLRSP